MRSTFVIALVVLLCILLSVDAHRSRRRGSRDRTTTTPPPVDIEVFQGNCPFDFVGLCSTRNPFARLGQPDFLKNVSDAGFKDFCQIVKNQTLTKAQLKAQLTGWAEKQGSSVYTLFKKYMKDQEERDKKIYEKIKELLKAIAKFFKELHKIEKNMRLTRKEEHQKIIELTKKTNSSVVDLADEVKLYAEFSMMDSPCFECGQMPSVELGPFGPHDGHGPMPGPYGIPHFPGDGDSGERSPYGEESPFGLGGPYGNGRGGNGDGYPFNGFGYNYDDYRFF